VAITVGPNPTWEVLQSGQVIWMPTEGGPFQPADNLVVRDTPTGYILEARIPWALLVGPNGLTNNAPVPGQLVGFNVLGNDGDNPDAPAQEHAMSFTGRPQAYLNPGAWATVQMDPPSAPSRPLLKIARETDGRVRLSWPTQATGFGLQRSLVLPGTWAAVSDPVTVEGDQNTVRIQPSSNTAYYRLLQ